jgi:hypothetical protein
MAEWKDIPCYKGLYEASSEGDIRSKENKITSSKRFAKRIWKQRIIKQKLRKAGNRRDAMVCLWKDGKPHYHLVSRLVASTFHDNLLMSKFTVNHIDGNTLNNRADNLELMTLTDNIKYGFKNGQYSSFMKPITAINVNNNIDTLYAKSYAEMDRMLCRYRGYTSRVVCMGRNILYNKTGVVYRITPF